MSKIQSFFKSKKGQRALIIVGFSIIPLILLLVFTYYPFLEMIKFSFYNMRYAGARKFVGFKNYITLFNKREIAGSLVLSLYYMVGAVIQSY